MLFGCFLVAAVVTYVLMLLSVKNIASVIMRCLAVLCIICDVVLYRRNLRSPAAERVLITVVL